MIIENINNMFKGWFIGDFEPSVYRTSQFEAGFKEHKAGEFYERHYHKEVTEINFLVYGSMQMHNKKLTKGDIFVVSPYEIADPIFFEDSGVICIKVPGKINDKIIFEEILNENN